MSLMCGDKPAVARRVAAISQLDVLQRCVLDKYCGQGRRWARKKLKAMMNTSIHGQGISSAGHEHDKGMSCAALDIIS